MSDGPTLYLAIEVLLVPWRSNPTRVGTAAYKASGTHVQRLERLLDDADARVILNSSLVHTAGYHTCLDILSDAIRLRTGGATIPGNRVLGSRIGKSASRRGWLEDDIRRRRANRVVILDHDFRYVPVQLRHLTLIASEGLGSATEDDWMRLRELLMWRGDA